MSVKATGERLREEIERLRAELEKERAACASWWSACEKHKAENARLRAALRIIAGEQQCVDNLMSNVDVARAALTSIHQTIPPDHPKR